MQDCSICSANALEIQQSCTKPLIYSNKPGLVWNWTDSGRILVCHGMLQRSSRVVSIGGPILAWIWASVGPKWALYRVLRLVSYMCLCAHVCVSFIFTQTVRCLAEMGISLLLNCGIFSAKVMEISPSLVFWCKLHRRVGRMVLLNGYLFVASFIIVCQNLGMECTVGNFVWYALPGI